MEDKNEKKENEGFTYGEGLIIVFNRSLPVIMTCLLHPSYMMVNAIILGKIKVDSTKCPDP